MTDNLNQIMDLEAGNTQLRDRIRERDGLLRELADKEFAGICCDEIVDRCLYCDWRSEDPMTEPQHDEGCPIVRARATLNRESDHDTD